MRRKRRWEEVVEDDPAASLLNLFDVWIAFAAALLLATVSYYNRSAAEAAAVRQLEQLKEQGIKIERYRPTDDQLTGQGERLGTAYRLANGEVVYVPDRSQ